MPETATAPPPRGFDRAEFEARLRGAQALMAEDGLSALLLCTEPELRYYSGFHTPFWLSPTRPFFLVLPARGAPVAVIPAIGESSMAATWVRDIRTWPAPRPEDDGVTLLADTLRELAGAGRIGVPMGPETHVRMPAADFDRLRDLLGTGRIVDATGIVRRQRMVKSPAEIARIAHVCAIASAAFATLPDLLATGQTERGAFAAFRMELLRQGADEVPYLVGSSGPGGFTDIIKQPSDRVLDRGDLLLFDTGAVFDGYFCDFDRNYAFGHASDAARRAYEVVHAATEAGLKAARPGNTCADLHRAMAAVMTAGGGDKSDVGRLGHGLGMQLTEWPSHMPTDRTVLQPGMVLTLEPGMSFDGGKTMLHEEDIVIREDGPELLTRRAAPELPIIR